MIPLAAMTDLFRASARIWAEMATRDTVGLTSLIATLPTGFVAFALGMLALLSTTTLKMFEVSAATAAAAAGAAETVIGGAEARMVVEVMAVAGGAGFAVEMVVVAYLETVTGFAGVIAFTAETF